MWSVGMRRDQTILRKSNFVSRILKSTYNKVCDDMEAFFAIKSKPAELREAVFRWMAEYSEDYHLLMSFIVHKKQNP